MRVQGNMQSNRLITIQRLSQALLSAVILLLVGAHPVHVFADATTTDPSTTTSAATADTDSDTTGATPTTPSNTATTDTTPQADDTTSSSSDPTTQPASDTTGTTADSAADTTTASDQTGDATIAANTTAGDATSGDAQTIASVLNILGSSTDTMSTSNLDTFVSNITGNSTGITIDPSLLDQTTTGSSTPTNVVVNTATDGTINNSVDTAATSGDANVVDNGSAGNATSGSAEAEANIINFLNSDVASDESFIGVINIYGNLTGNIFIPSQYLDSLLTSSGSAPTSTAATDNDETINNQVQTAATSGDANVVDNGSAGNATSGNATTNVDILDLANSQIVGSNALLVFVNVLGTWFGMILNAPAGTTSAVLGGGASETSAAPDGTDPATTAAANNEQINNTVAADATSGNATVADNGTAGNATSGNAAVGVNLLNIINSDFSLTNWFGILFINVFGTWDGSLEVAPPPITTSAVSGATGVLGDATDTGSTPVNAILSDANMTGDYSAPQNNPTQQVLGLATVNNPTAPLSNTGTDAGGIAHNTHNWMLAIAGVALGAASLGLEEILKKQKA
jgi:hypothetical protein